MIKINIQMQNKKIVYFKIEGHANAAAYGEDVICAAVSSVAQMTLNGYVEVLELKNLKYKEENGLIICDLKSSNLTEEQFEKAHILSDSMHSYLREVADIYPKFVKIKIRHIKK